MNERVMEENIYTNGSLALNKEEVYQEVSNEKVEAKPKKRFYSIIKRATDIVVGLIGVILLVPITVILYIANLFNKESRGPLFYKQERIGKNGKPFKIYKYRTMVVGADQILEKYLQENEVARKEFAQTQKLSNDPRITKFGKVLRKTSLDEFPQFINVLKGDMSLIGPRPLVKGELDSHNGNHEIYESVKPGISGWWAANGRSELLYDERLELEYYYAENCSLWLDLKCIFKTIVTVIKKEGAK